MLLTRTSSLTIILSALILFSCSPGSAINEAVAVDNPGASNTPGIANNLSASDPSGTSGIRSTTDTHGTNGIQDVPDHHLPERPLPREVIPPRGYQLSVMRDNRSPEGQPGENYWQQFAEYDIEATLDPEARKLSATAKITWHNNSPDTLRRMHLELVQNHHAEGVMRNRPAEITGGIQLHRVVVNGTDYDDEQVSRNRYTVNGTRMSFWLDRPVGAGETAKIEIDYEFLIPQRGASGRMGHSRDNLFYLGYWYPHMVVYDDVVGWHPDPYLGQAEFYHGFAEYNLTIHVPEEWLVMATGELQNPEEVLDPHVLSRWMEARESDEPLRVYTAGAEERATLPARESGSNGMLAWRFFASSVRDVAFSVTRESHWDAARTSVGDLNGDGQNDYTVINTFWREDAPLWSEVTAYQQHAISFLSEMTGFPYPWPHMTAVEGAEIIGGGMEYPMMTIMGDYNLRGAQALYGVTAHELAHMWVPLIVSTDERRYSWLDEGNTVFSTSEAVLDYHPDRDLHRRGQATYLGSARRGQEGPMMRRSDYHYSPDHFRVASYSKPATVLVALRKVLGEDVFWEAYRTFVDDWAFKQAYPWDFFRTFERVSDRDLSWFWHSWYYETWVLNQAIASVEEVAEGTRIVIRDEGEVPMPVYLTVTREDDTVSEHTIPVDIWLQGVRQAELIVPYRDVTYVEIDADTALPDVDRSNMFWARENHDR